MPLTTLDPEYRPARRSDLQKGLVGSPFNHPIRDMVDRARATIGGGAPDPTEQPRRHSDVFPEGFTDFIPELDQQRSA
jgi:hypothetical protein